MRPLTPLPLALGPELAEALPLLAAALAGEAPVAPYAAGSPPPPGFPAPGSGAVRLDSGGVPDDLAVVIGTSGSTGAPKEVLLSARALAASIGATHRHLGGPGQWLLALPPHHIGGLQVLLRGLVAGTTTVVLPRPANPAAYPSTSGPTPPTAPGAGRFVREFAAATTHLDPDQRRYTSLVPTQVRRLLADEEGVQALRAFDAILVGGAALPPELRARADRQGIVLVATYGMSETAGGCVYDGTPLEPTSIRLTDDGRILLGGATLAHGYLSDPARTAAAFTTDPDGERWFRTDDHGIRMPNGRLHVTGRLDDLINTGGLKVAPRPVEEALLAHVPEAGEVVVVGTPDPEWGERVVAVLVPAAPGSLRPGEATATTHLPSLTEVRARLRGALPDHALPKEIRWVTAIPTRGPGKPDRRAVADALRQG